MNGTIIGAIGMLIGSLIAGCASVPATQFAPCADHVKVTTDGIEAAEDRQFIVSLLKANAETNATVDPELIALLMGEGDDYLGRAQHHFDPAMLSEGVSTAYGAYRAVLRPDPANRAAAEKILEIVKLYESQARALQGEGQYKRAATLVSYALKIAPDRQSLRQLKSDLEPLAAKDSDPGR